MMSEISEDQYFHSFELFLAHQGDYRSVCGDR